MKIQTLARCRRPLRWFALLLPTLVVLGCGSGALSGGYAPKNGKWQGAELSFSLQDGVLDNLVLAEQACSGEGACGGLIGGPVEGSFAAPSVFTLVSGGATIKGTFTSWTQASGTLAVDAGCCSVVGLWTADWVPGSDTPDQPGSLNWGGASTGTIHPGPTLKRTPPASPDGASQVQVQASDWLDALRAQVGVGPVPGHAALHQAAQAHAEFYTLHAGQYQASGLSPHNENASFGAGFTGATVGQRLAAAGYASGAASEVMAFTGSVPGAMQGWLDTVYHRLPMLDPTSFEMGFGLANSGGAQAEVMDVSAVQGSSADPIVVYPWPGQTGVPAGWSGNEGPQPPAPPGGYPCGPVISARFPSKATVKLHSLKDAQGNAVPHVWLDAANDPNMQMFDPTTVVLYAHTPVADGDYVVRLEVQVAGQDQVLEWRFRVGP